MKIIINPEKSYSHYCYTEDELYKIIKMSLEDVNSLYAKLDKIEDVSDEEKISLYNIIDIFWNIRFCNENTK